MYDITAPQAYRLRKERNTETFKQLAEELKNLGADVYVSTTDKHLITGIRVEYEDKHIYFSFCEVPYRWVLSIDTVFTKSAGNGKTLESLQGTENYFTAQYILDRVCTTVRPRGTHYVKI